MLVRDAKDATRSWVNEAAGTIPGASGAFFHGSMIERADDETLPATSDVDVIIVLDGVEPAEKPGKFRYRDVILDVSFLPREQLQSAEYVLGQYHLAGSFRAPSVIWDPAGWLTPLQAAVARDFAKRPWVERRCDHAAEKVLAGFPMNASDPTYNQVVAWLFPAGVLTHVLLVAGLQNPTVRRRYVTARALLAEYGHLDLYPALLKLLGCEGMSRERVTHHLATLTKLFDVAKTVVRSPFPFAADISDLARPIAIGGSREFIEQGNHREAIFWITATYARCMHVLEVDGTPAMVARFDPGYRALLSDLGITSFADMQDRFERVKAALPRVRSVAGEILAANPGVEG